MSSSEGKKNKRSLLVLYCVVQAFYWGGYCCFGGYAAVYLQAHNYSNTELGLILALANIGGFLLAPVLANIIDKSKRVTVFQCLFVMLVLEGILEFILTFVPCSDVVVGVLFCILMIIAVAVNPLNTDMCFALDSSGKYINYGAARSFGSLAFAGVSMALGALVVRFSPEVLPLSGLILVAVQFIVLLVIIRVKNKYKNTELEEEKDSSDDALSLIPFLRQNTRFLFFCLGLCLLNFSSCLLSSYLINIVENLGGDSSNMGFLSSITALAEVPTMIFYTRITKNIGCSTAIKIASVMYVAKAVFYLWAPSVTILYFSCLLQAVSYAVLIPAMVDYTNIVVSYSDLAKGQSVCAALYTLGNVFSSQFGGILLDHISVKATMAVGVAVCVVGALICIVAVNKTKPKIELEV